MKCITVEITENDSNVHNVSSNFISVNTKKRKNIVKFRQIDVKIGRMVN